MVTNPKQPVRRRPPKFQLVAGAACLDFINTLDDRFTDAPQELLKDYLDVARFGEDTGIIDDRRVDHLFPASMKQSQEAKRVLEDAIELREVLFEVFWAIVKKKTIPALAMVKLNQWVQAAAPHFKLVPANGHFEWQLETMLSDFRAPLWPIARSAADLLGSDQLEFVRACASSTCQWLFLDTSKNHGRRWCDMKLCGNRAKFQRFYERQKTS